MTSLEKTKQEVEQQLALRSARIESAVSKLRGDVSSPASIITQFIRKHPFETLGGIAAIGAVAAFIALRSGSKSKERDDEDGVKSAYADAISRSIQRAEEQGASRNEAVHRAILQNPPILVQSSNSKSNGYLHEFGERVIASLTAVAFNYASSWISELLEGRRSTS
jgi:hypothetical protein